ncbi:M6 family metalloprotease domain-containing protein, partial [Streptomyces sp. WAC04114]
MSREPYPEVPVPRPFPRARLRSTAAVFTTMSALAATSLGAGPSVAGPDSAVPCALTRTDAHHSEGLDTWNAAYPRPARSLNAVMVFLSFPDAHPLTTPQELTADHFPATTRFFERASYGRFTLRPHALRHWIRMPEPSTAYAIRRDWKSEHRAAYLRDALSVADPRVDFSRYDVVYFVADPDAPGVDSDATKVVNLTSPLRADGTDLRRIVTVFEQHPPDRLVLAHETGHVFDLPDLYHRPADGKGDWDTHVGDWDLMGSQFGLAPDLFAWHKWKLGWLNPRQVRCVQDAGPLRLTLEPLAAGPGVPTTGAAGPQPFGLGRGTKLAVVRTGPDSVLALEVRGQLGNDVAACRQGVLVY